MKNIFLLIKKDFIQATNIISHPASIIRDKKSRTKALAFVFILGLLIFYSYLVGSFFYNGILLEEIPLKIKEELIKNLILYSFLGVAIISFMLSIASIISGLYQSSEINVLERLPIKAKDILASKLIAFSFIMPSIVIPVLAPSAWIYTKVMNSSPVFYIYVITSAIGISMISIALLSLLVVPLMRLINKIPNAKKILQFIGMVSILVFSFGIQMVSSKFGASSRSNGAFAQNIKGSPLFDFLPQIKLAKYGLEQNSLTMILIGLVIFILGLVIILIVSRLLEGQFIKGRHTNQISLARKRNVEEKEYKKTSVLTSLVKKELKNIFGEPAYIFNLLTIGLILPLALAMPIFLNGQLEFSKISAYANDIFNNIPLEKLEIFSIAALVGHIFSMALTGSGQSATTSITREGKGIWLIKALPIKTRVNVDARLITSLIIELINLIPANLLLIILLRPALIIILGLFTGELISMIFSANLGLLAGILKPKLDWDTANQAIKQNFAVFVFTLLTMGYTGGSIFLIVKYFVAASKDAGHLISVFENYPIYIGSFLAAILIISLIIRQINIWLLKKKLINY